MREREGGIKDALKVSVLSNSKNGLATYRNEEGGENQ